MKMFSKLQKVILILAIVSFVVFFLLVWKGRTVFYLHNAINIRHMKENQILINFLNDNGFTSRG